MFVIIKILATALVILMNILCVPMIINGFKAKRYAYSFVGITFIVCMLYYWCKILLA